MNLDYNSLMASVQKSLDNSIYLIYGEDQFLIDEILKKIKKYFDQLMVGINYIMLDDTNVQDLIDDIESPAFGFDKKLIIVKNSLLFKKDGRKKAGNPIQEKIAKYIIENEDLIDESCILVFIETEARKKCCI